MLEEATNRWAAYYQNKKAIDTVGLSLSMVYLADGRRDDLVAELAAKHWRNKRLPAEVAAAVAVCGDRASAQRMHPIVANLLGRKGDEWLTRGHFDRFAAWVKVGVADRDAGLSRPEILRDAMSAALKVQ